MGEIVYEVPYTPPHPIHADSMLSWILAAIALAPIAQAERFNPLHHSGPASPYFDAPVTDNVDYDTPDGCVVEQAAYLVRHGRSVFVVVDVVAHICTHTLAL